MFGNGPFAVPLLERMAASRHRIGLVVTRPDRPQGKHQTIVPGPVRCRAESLGLPTAQPDDVNSTRFVEQLASERADIHVVADFGQILSRECLASARRGGINVHASLLPKYRGAAPVAWAIYNGEFETGVSILQMTPKMDAGAVVAQTTVPIESNDTSATLEARLAILGADLGVEALDRLEAGSAVLLEQDPHLVTKAPRLKKDDGRVRWDRTARLVDAQVRAMQPWPIAFTDWQRSGESPMRLQILKVEIPPSASAMEPAASPGAIVHVSSRDLWIATGESGVVAIQRLKPAGKREMDIATFLNGHYPTAGEKMN